MRGQMMDYPLTVTSIMRFAQRVHSRQEIVSLTADNPGHRYTYGDAFRRTHQLANALHALGVGRGERVGTLAWNDYRHLELYFGVAGYGSVCHTINPRLFPEQIVYIINHAEDQWLFIDPMFVPLLEKLQDKLPHVKGYVVLSDEAHMPATDLRNVFCYEELIEGRPNTFNWPSLDEYDAAAMCYTSGTTGDPKGVLYSHRSIVLHAMMTAMSDVMGISARTVLMPVVPMFHVNAWGAVHVAAMVGAKLVFPGAKMGDGAVLTDLINTERVNYSLGVPTIWLGLVKYLETSGQTIPSLDAVVIGGAACPLSLMQALENFGVWVHAGWGMTETSPLGVYNTLLPWMDDLSEDERNRYRVKAGRAIYGVELKLENEAGNELPWDGKTSGELKVRGPWVADSYYRLEGLDHHFEGGWFATGDVATIDEYGYLRITDRTKDVIKSGGEWISSIDVENAVMAHPDVAEAAVIGVSHPKWGERPLLVVVPAGESKPDVQGILQFLRGKIADWWVPDACELVDELPHTATGKVSKKDLRVRFQDYSFS